MEQYRPLEHNSLKFEWYTQISFQENVIEMAAICLVFNVVLAMGDSDAIALWLPDIGISNDAVHELKSK